jgi:phage tail-like protein
MAGETQNTIWPLPKFSFSVRLRDDLEVLFQEVAGLESDPKVIEYRHGDSPAFSSSKMPGLHKFGNVTLRRGVFAKDPTFWAWYSEIKQNTIARRTVVIRLLDERGAPVMVWTLSNAWPTKITGTDLKAEGNEVAIETLEIAYETLVVSSA